MTSVSGVSGSSNYFSQASSGVQRHGRGDPAKIADSVFSKLDTKNQGYLEISDLETAFGNISDTSSSTTSSSTTSTASSTSSAGTSNTSSSSTVNDLFKKLDSDGDGKVTKDEFSSGIKKLSDELESQFNARRTSGSRPPPPPDGGGGPGGDGGLDKTQLTDLASKVGESNSSAGAALTQVAQNFEAADTNQDGKVSIQESIAYLEKTASTSSTASTGASTTSSSSGTTTSNDSTGTGTSTGTTSGTSSTTASSGTDSTSNTSDAAIFKKALQLLRAYAVPPQDQTQGLSVTA
ncbi:EF-hand domain-containing protein [Undibacterium sp. Ji50W]|uniref:EF-hand domain-containing protein n=1 Tax=Undibacterium sp. Ji50W TaxID=3413041 RepID=UPI003BF2A373